MKSSLVNHIRLSVNNFVEANDGITNLWVVLCPWFKKETAFSLLTANRQIRYVAKELKCRAIRLCRGNPLKNI